jgi:hypothetical protein
MFHMPQMVATKHYVPLIITLATHLEEGEENKI